MADSWHKLEKYHFKVLYILLTFFAEVHLQKCLFLNIKFLPSFFNFIFLHTLIVITLVCFLKNKLNYFSTKEKKNIK